VSDQKKPSNSSRRDSGALNKPLLGLLFDWIDQVQAAAREHLEAELDRASFESFPASDPAAPSMASQHRSAVRIDCVVAEDRVTFTRALRTDDTGPAVRGEATESIEGETPSGVRVSIDVRRRVEEDAAAPQSLELEPEHASILPRQEERRSGNDRRTASAPPQRERRGGSDRRAAS
jgi:hypothetical protein